MKTIVVIEVEHRKALPHLGDMIAGRAYTIDGVTNAELMKFRGLSAEELQGLGFSLEEICLGSAEVERS